MTTMRVFLHDLPWQQDAAGYRARIDRFLAIAAKHHIKPLFVLFDSCWDPNPRLGPQHAPTPGVHNSGWVQSPGATGPEGSRRSIRGCAQYVVGVVGAFGKDARVLGLGRLERARQHERQQLRHAGAGEQGGPRAGAAAAGVRVGARGRRRAAADVGRVEGRLVGGREAVGDGAHPARTVGRDLVPQLRQRPGVREAHHVAAAVSPPDPLHRVHGARATAARSRARCRSRSSTTSRRSTGASSRARRRRICRGTRGRSPTCGREPSIWFHEIFKQDGTPYRQDEVELIRSLTEECRACTRGGAEMTAFGRRLR